MDYLIIEGSAGDWLIGTASHNDSDSICESPRKQSERLFIFLVHEVL